jgi:hypothetical protein
MKRHHDRAELCVASSDAARATEVAENCQGFSRARRAHALSNCERRFQKREGQIMTILAIGVLSVEPRSRRH